MKSTTTSQRKDWASPARVIAVLVAMIVAIAASAQPRTPAAVAPASAPAQKVNPAAQDAPCLKCHDDLYEEPVVHGAATKGCTACHSQIDASKRPHKVNGSTPFGLAAAEPVLCMNCHDGQKFKKKTVHGAPEKGCFVCHEPHSSKQNNLLKAAVPQLCVSCHKERTYYGKGLHSAVSGGRCLKCHGPHGSDQSVLLVKPPAETCLECHDDIKEAPHMLAGFSRKGHPIGDEKRPQPAADPLRPGKPFYCASCHEPHKSDFPKLLRMDPKQGMNACLKCHPK